MKSLRYVCLLGVLSLCLGVFAGPLVPHPTLPSALAGPVEPLDLNSKSSFRFIRSAYEKIKDQVVAKQ